MRSKIINLSIIGLLDSLLLVGVIYVARGNVPPTEIVRRYYGLFRVTWSPDNASYTLTAVQLRRICISI